AGSRRGGRRSDTAAPERLTRAGAATAGEDEAARGGRGMGACGRQCGSGNGYEKCYDSHHGAPVQ
ncbi:MAG: hypothetical protein ACRDQZ_04140, partial [Mycobacteriales bacterium]